MFDLELGTHVGSKHNFKISHKQDVEIFVYLYGRVPLPFKTQLWAFFFTIKRSTNTTSVLFYLCLSKALRYNKFSFRYYKFFFSCKAKCEKEEELLQE